MEEALFAFGPAILAVAVAVFLRMRTSRREAREEIAAFQKRKAAIEQRARQLQQEREQSGEGVGDNSFPQSGSNPSRFGMSVLESTAAAQQVQPVARPRPFAEVRGEPPEQQFLVFTADRDFKLSRIDYVSNRGTTVISEDVEKCGSRIEVPINEKKISRVWYLLPRVNQAPTEFRFLCHLSLDGAETQSVLPAVIQQRYAYRHAAYTFFRYVTLTAGAGRED
jgi:type II secretory pathway pseudopilin PulG